MGEFVYSVVASSLHDADSVDRITSALRSELDELGGRRTDGVPDSSEPFVIVMATGGTERPALDLVEARHRLVPWEPVVLVAHPLHNSLPASLEALAAVRARGAGGMIVQTPAADLGEAIADLVAVHAIRQARIGLVGEPSDWLVASVPDRERLAERWGVELVDIDITATIEQHSRVTDDVARPVAVKFTPQREPDDEVVKAAALHPALLASIDENGVDAVAVRCFDFLTELSTSGCVALAELNDTGIVAGCEGDVASTLAMMIVRTLLDQPAWVANPAVIDPSENTILLAHCTIAPSMVDDLEIHTHFESGLGIGLRGSFRPGWVTLLRLGGDALERHRIVEAEILHGGESPDLCRTQVTVKVEGDDVGDILRDPLGNHVVMVRGRHRARLERWWRLATGDS